MVTTQQFVRSCMFASFKHHFCTKFKVKILD